jgi:hypothetical protein
MTKAQLLQVLIGVPDDAQIHGMNQEFGESYPPSHVTYNPAFKRVVLRQDVAIPESTPHAIVLWDRERGQVCCCCDTTRQAEAKLATARNEGPLTREELQAIQRHATLTRDEASDASWVD